GLSQKSAPRKRRRHQRELSLWRGVILTPDHWNPEQYGRFRDERSQPFFDLVALVQRRPAMRVVDLGCGPGELTRALHDDLKADETIGVDNSEAMLARSQAFMGHGVSFERVDLREFA